MKQLQTRYFAVLFLLALIFLPESVSAKDDWLQVRSKNFNLIGNAGEKDIRKVATKLEQFRESFRLLFTNTNVNSPIPTNVVVFKSSGSYKPFKPKRADGKIDEFIAGYFQPGEDVNYITLSTGGEIADVYGTIFHEYVHFIIDTNFGKSDVPPWFNEGLAEYYQTFEIEDDQKVKLGLPQNGHLELLQQTKLIPLDTFFGINNYSLGQNGNHSRSIFYAQSWALIHYLLQSGRSEALGKFLDLSLRNSPTEKTFQDAFQMNYEQMEKELKKYVAKRSYQYQMVTLKEKLVFDNEMQVSALSEGATNAYLGDLLYHTNRADDAEAYLQKAIAAEPKSSMANTTLGMVKMRQKKYDEAKTYLDRAISEDQRNHRAFYQSAYLLSREDRDEFGYVSAFPSDKSGKMRELLKKAIQINPSFTESYELLAFVNLVNNEELEESIEYLKKALQFQPGNQRYALRIAEIYLRQEKFDEAGKLAGRIAATTDDGEVKARAENLSVQVRRTQENFAQNEKARKDYEEAIANAEKSGGRVVLTRRTFTEEGLSPEAIAKLREQEELVSINRTLKTPEENEQRVLGKIQKIECKGGAVIYTVKTAENETLLLSSKDFQNLELFTFIQSNNVQVGCGENLSNVNSVLYYKTNSSVKPAHKGELTAISFVPEGFRFVDFENETEQVIKESGEIFERDENSSTPNPTEMPDFEAQRRDMMMESLKKAMRVPQSGEKREIGFLEKIECTSKGTFFHLKSATTTYKFRQSSPQSPELKAFTSEMEQVQFGCNLQRVDVPVVFTYKEELKGKDKTNGEIIALEFVPRSFKLEQ